MVKYNLKKIKKCISVITLIMIMSFAMGCGSSGSSKPDNAAKEEELEKTDNDTVKAEDMVDGAVQISINSNKAFQKIRGFGAGFTYYSNYLYYNKYKEEVYDLLFKDLNLTILRFKNAYKYDAEKDYNTKVEREYYEEAKKRLAEDGLKPEVLMSSWTPAQYLKDSKNLYGEGTLVKDKDGNYKYEKLGQYWRELVDYYGDNGVPIDYISIQNEPDYVAAYESCTFDFLEREGAASFAKAHMAVYDATRSCKKPPKMLGPETMSCDSGIIGLMTDDILAEKPESLFGIAHHLYVGGEEGNAKSFNSNFRSLAIDYPDIEKWMTEYYRGDFMFTVQIIQNSLSIENLNSYIYWGGVWKGPVGNDYENLIGIDSGQDENYWTHEHGYVIGEKYYAMKHFSEYILPGYTRVGAAVDTRTYNEKNNNSVSTDDISCSAYMSPEKDRMVLVAVNNLDHPKKYQFNFGEYNVNNSKVILSNYEKGQETDEFYVEAGSLDDKGCFEIPGHSVITVVIDGK